MILGIGTDIVDIERFEKMFKKFEEKSLNRLFTEKERNKAKKSNLSINFYAKRFAAKEAFVKAIGTGISKGISWQDIEIDNLDSGKPFFNIKGKAEEIMNSIIPKNHIPIVHLSLSDSKNLAQATVIIEAQKK